MKRQVFLGIMALVLVGCASQQERAERQAQTRVAVEQAVTSRQLHIDIHSMSAMRYGSRTVTPDFFLELRGDTLRSYLPYLGQAHTSPTVSSSIGLNFKAPIKNFSERKLKAGKTQWELDVKTQEDAHHFIIEVFDTGQAFISVRSQNRDPISFDGAVGSFEQ